MNQVLQRLATIVGLLSDEVRIQVSPVRPDSERNRTEWLSLQKNPVDGCFCVMIEQRENRLSSGGAIESTTRPCDWSLSKALERLSELDAESARRIDDQASGIHVGDSRTMSHLIELARRNGRFETRIAASDWTLDFVDGRAVLTSSTDSTWSLNAAVMMVVSGR